MIPLIISYTPNNLNSLNKGANILYNLSGIHICQFYYATPSERNKHKRVRIKIKGKDWGIIAEIGKDKLCLCNPWFKMEREMKTVNEDDAITKECKIIFTRQNPINIIIEDNLHEFIPAINKFILSCSNIKKPILPVKKEEEKEIWTAYCEGLNALNKEKRDFISVNFVGKPILYNDTRQGDIYTIKLGIVSESIDDIEQNLFNFLKDKYQIDSVTLNEGKNKLFIHFNGTENLNSEDLEDINKYIQSYGFSLSAEGVNNILKMSVSLGKLKDRIDLYDKLDLLLQEKGVQFENNEKLEYHIQDDSLIETFQKCVSNVFGNLATTIISNKFHIKIDFDNNQQLILQELFEGNNNISVHKKGVIFEAKNKEDFLKILGEIEQNLTERGFEYESPTYKTICKIVSNSDLVIRQTLLNHAADELERMKALAINYEYDSSLARVIRLDFRFKSAHERESVAKEMDYIMSKLGPNFKLTNKKPLGFTRLAYELDEVLIRRQEEDFKYEYFDEEIKLVDSNTFNYLFKNIKDAENIIDPILREKYNRFMAECPIIGTCHKRTSDYIIINLSEDFYNGEKLKTSIKENDMIFFPSRGTSTELRRQYEAIQRINKPGVKLSNGRKIIPPINPGLSDFLFSPLYARDIKINVEDTMNIIRRKKLEKNLNEKQIEAIAKAILAEDIFFIQGPPGTGKTTVIAEIIYQEILRNPKCKILLTSQTNLAVDNALERLKYKKNIRPLRVISDSKSSDDDFIYNANILEEWTNSPNENNKENVVNYWIDSIVKHIEENQDYVDETKEWHDYLLQKGPTVRHLFAERYKSNVNLIAATCSLCGSQQFTQAFTKMYDEEEVAFDVVIMDEASKATPLEMAIPMVLGKKIIVIGDHKQLPPVLDENSIDTSLRKIGRDDLAEKILDLKESQFKKLFQMAQKFRPSLVTTLDTQYRMHSDIMQTINHFYVDELGENGLTCGIKDVQDIPDYHEKGSRWHGISLEPFISPSTHAIWVNVEGREEKESTSYRNMDEVKAVNTVIKALALSPDFSKYIGSQDKLENQEIGLITFYSAQKKELKKLEQSGALDTNYDYRIEVVDRFQGMERNIIIVSTVRSNHYNGIGFAKEIERINVALSRARSLLIVVGNKELFSSKYNYKQSIASMETIEIKQIEDMINYGKNV